MEEYTITITVKIEGDYATLSILAPEGLNREEVLEYLAEAYDATENPRPHLTRVK